MRLVACLAGVLIIAAATLATIEATGGFSGTGWTVPAAVAIGLIAGSACVGSAWRSKRHLLALVLGFAIVAGEIFALISTGERIISHRDAVSIPDRNATRQRQEARTALDAAKAVMPTTSARLDKAEAALSAANAAVATSAAERNCAANCRTLLEQQVTTARTEQTAARTAFDDEKTRAQNAITTAQQKLDSIPAPVHRVGLAERLGISSWALDLMSAALASLALNGLGAGLIAFGSHDRTAQPVRTIDGMVEVFLADMLDTKAGAALAVRDLYRSYITWCSRQQVQPVPPDRFGDDLRAVIERLHLPVRRDARGALFLDGVTLSGTSLALPAA
jgi:hypothetical protein